MIESIKSLNGNQHFGHFRNIYPHVLTLQVCLFKNRISMIARDSQTVIVVTCDLTSDKSNGIERSVMKTWDTNENGYLLARRNNSGDR